MISNSTEKNNCFFVTKDEEVVPLPNVNAAILRKVIQWATYHKDDPPIPEDDENKEKRTDDICSWDADFLKVGKQSKATIPIEMYSAAVSDVGMVNSE